MSNTRSHKQNQWITFWRNPCRVDITWQHNKEWWWPPPATLVQSVLRTIDSMSQGYGTPILPVFCHQWIATPEYEIIALRADYCGDLVFCCFSTIVPMILQTKNTHILSIASLTMKWMTVGAWVLLPGYPPQPWHLARTCTINDRYHHCNS